MADSAVPQHVVDNRIALKINDPGTASFDSELFQKARQTGIDLLEISFPTSISHSVLSDFFLLLDTTEDFGTIYELEKNQESILNSIRLSYNTVPDQLRGNIAAIKLFDFPADYDERFPAASRNILSGLSGAIDQPFYYQSAFSHPDSNQDQFDFISGRIITRHDSTPVLQEPVLLFEPSGDVTRSLQMLENVLNQSLSYPESVIIIPAEWFFSRMEDQEAFAQIISSYLNGNSVTIPMPDNNPGYPHVNWPVIFLLIIWGSFIIHYKHQPMYKSALPRYFFNHSFFVHDIMRYRIQNASSGGIVLFQHALLAGFFFYLIADAFISEAGLNSLAVHFPFMIYTGFEELCIFLAGLTIGLFSHAISIAWLYLLNKQLKQLNQVTNLYSWPLHINLVIVTLMVYFVQLNSIRYWLIVAIAGYFLVWFFSFTIAAIDSAKFLQKHKALNLFLTVGIHFLLITAAVVLIFRLPFIFEPLEMAFRLP